MIINGKQFNPIDTTIGQYEKILDVSQNEQDTIERYLKILKIYGYNDDDLDTLTADMLNSVIEEINTIEYNVETTSVEIDGYTYSIRKQDNQLFINAKDLAKIESIYKSNDYHKASKILAVVFKREDLSRIEHYDDSHIKYKSELFRSLPMTDYMAILTSINLQILNALKFENETNTTTAE